VTTRHVGPLNVRIDETDAAALANAVVPGANPGTVPLIFPLRWLAVPELRTALADLVASEDRAVLHESQRFDCVRPPLAGQDYELTAELTRQDTEPPRITIAAVVRDQAGEIMRLITVLRAVKPAA